MSQMLNSRKAPCCPKTPPVAPSCCVVPGMSVTKEFQAHFRNGLIAPFILGGQFNATFGPSPPPDDPAEVVQLLADANTTPFGFSAEFLASPSPVVFSPRTQDFCFCTTFRVAQLTSSLFDIGLASFGQLNLVLIDATDGTPTFFLILSSTAGTATIDTGVLVDTAYHSFKVCGSGTATTVTITIDDVVIGTFGPFPVEYPLDPLFAFMEPQAGGTGIADIRIDEYCADAGFAGAALSDLVPVPPPTAPAPGFSPAKFGGRSLRGGIQGIPSKP